MMNIEKSLLLKTLAVPAACCLFAIPVGVLAEETAAPEPAVQALADASAVPEADLETVMPETVPMAEEAAVETELGVFSAPETDPETTPEETPETPETSTLSFDSDGGSAVEDVVAETGSVVTVHDYVPYKEGHVFTGWFAAEESTPVEELILNQDIILKAHWNVILTFDMGEEASAEVNAPAGTIIYLSPYVPVRPGYAFEGWLDENNDMVEEITLDAPQTIYAAWSMLITGTDPEEGNEEETAPAPVTPYLTVQSTYFSYNPGYNWQSTTVTKETTKKAETELQTINTAQGPATTKKTKTALGTNLVLNSFLAGLSAAGLILLRKKD